MNSNALLIMFLLATLFASCKKEQMDHCLMGTGEIKTENRTLESFSHLVLNDVITVNYVQSQNYGLSLRAGEKLMPGIKTEVKNGVLYITNENRCNWVRSFKKKIEITLFAPELKSLEQNGGSSFACSDTIKTDEFRANLWNASGKLELLLRANYVELKSHTGPGDVVAKGRCTELVTYLNGNGTLDCLGLMADQVLALNLNTGKLKVSANQKLNVELRGSGDIYYLGNPQISFLNEGKGNLVSLN